MCENCGNCRWHLCDNGDWFCNNQNSDMYEEFTEYNDECDSFEERIKWATAR